MAKTQVKPTSGGSWNDMTTYGKNVTGVSNLQPYQLNQLLHASNVFTLSSGQGANAGRAAKIAAAVGRTLQWV